MSGGGLARLSRDIAYNDEDGRARDACRHATCPLRRVCIPRRLARAALVAPARAGLRALVPPRSSRAGNVRAACPPSRISMVDVTSPRWWHRGAPASPLRRAVYWHASLARLPPGPSVVDYLMSGTPWVPPALFDTHGVPLVVTVVEMSAIGGRGERRLAECSGGRAVVPDGSAALASFALHPSAHLVTERVRRARGCRAKAARGGRCRRRGGRQGAGSGARAAATPVSAGGRRRQGTAGECESREVGGNSRRRPSGRFAGAVVIAALVRACRAGRHDDEEVPWPPATTPTTSTTTPATTPPLRATTSPLGRTGPAGGSAPGRWGRTTGRTARPTCRPPAGWRPSSGPSGSSRTTASPTGPRRSPTTGCSPSSRAYWC